MNQHTHRTTRWRALAWGISLWLSACGGGSSGGSDTPDTSALSPAPAMTLDPGLGVASYWGSSLTPYLSLPAGSLAVLNPELGVIAPGSTQTPVSSLATWQRRSADLHARGVRHLGYVPTGYFRHDCDRPGQCQTWARIEAQVSTYLRQMPQLDGLFFDEVAPTTWDCGAFAAEYARLRALVERHRPGAGAAPLLAFNPGIADTCVLAGLQAGEVIAVFEGTAASHAERHATITEVTRLARERGLQPWHLVHTAPTSADLKAVVARARQSGASWLGVASASGLWQTSENTWGALPTYWDEMLGLMRVP